MSDLVDNKKDSKRDPVFAAYAQEMAEYQRATRVVRPATTTQCASTQAIIDRPKELDDQWQNRPMPEATIAQTKDNWAAFRSGDENQIKKAINQRELPQEQVDIVESIRRKAEANTFGASEKSTHTETMRYLTAVRHCEMIEQNKKEEKKPDFASRFLHRLWKWGFPVSRFIKKTLSIEVADGK